MLGQIRPAIVSLILLSVITGLVYPAVITESPSSCSRARRTVA